MRLSVENLELIRNERRLFSGLSFTLESGGAMLLTGPNGSGKSSLLRVLLGLLSPVAGSIKLSDTDLFVAENAHFLGMTEGLKTALTAGENLAFWRDMLKQTATRSPAQALAALNLAALEHTPVAYMSAGQRRRVALARLLVAHRSIWLLDEPTNALDTATKALFGELCAQHRASGGMIIAATHIDVDLPSAQTLQLGAST